MHSAAGGGDLAIPRCGTHGGGKRFIVNDADWGPWNGLQHRSQIADDGPPGSAGNPLNGAGIGAASKLRLMREISKQRFSGRSKVVVAEANAERDSYHRAIAGRMAARKLRMVAAADGEAAAALQQAKLPAPDFGAADDDDDDDVVEVSAPTLTAAE